MFPTSTIKLSFQIAVLTKSSQLCFGTFSFVGRIVNERLAETASDGRKYVRERRSSRSSRGRKRRELYYGLFDGLNAIWLRFQISLSFIV